jgi:hypothetical protein
MNETVADIDRQIANGVLPLSLDFNFLLANQPDEVDMSKLQYQSFYKTFEYAQSKYPVGIHGCRFMDAVIEATIDETKSPLELMEERLKAVPEHSTC